MSAKLKIITKEMITKKDDKYVCAECKKEFPLKSSLYNHLKKKHEYKTQREKIINELDEAKKIKEQEPAKIEPIEKTVVDKADGDLPLWNIDDLSKNDNLSIVLYGTPQSGKTTMILTICKQILPNYDFIFLISTNSDNKRRYVKDLGLEECALLDGFNSNKTQLFLKRLKDVQDKISDNKRLKVLIIGDDIIDENNDQKNGLLDSMISDRRHLNIDFIMSSQVITKQSTTTRRLANMVICFYSKDKQYIDYIYESYFSKSMTRNECIKLIDRHCSNHGCLILYPSQQPPNDLYRFRATI
jgi:DNA replication protein DnaC